MVLQQGHDLVVAPLVGPDEAGLLLVLLLLLLLVVGGGGGPRRPPDGAPRRPGRHVDVGPPVEEVVDDPDVALVAGRVEGRMPVPALHVGGDVAAVEEVGDEVPGPAAGAGGVERRLAPDVLFRHGVGGGRGEQHAGHLDWGQAEDVGQLDGLMPRRVVPNGMTIYKGNKL